MHNNWQNVTCSCPHQCGEIERFQGNNFRCGLTGISVAFSAARHLSAPRGAAAMDRESGRGHTGHISVPSVTCNCRNLRCTTACIRINGEICQVDWCRPSTRGSVWSVNINFDDFFYLTRWERNHTNFVFGCRQYGKNETFSFSEDTTRPIWTGDASVDGE